MIILAHEVYICYSEEDKNAADAICHVLEENHIKCWIKPRDVGIKHEVLEIKEAIRESKALVLVYSMYSKNSSFVNTEIDIAFSSNIPILVFKIDNSNKNSNLEFYLKDKHWLDAYPNPTHEFKNLIIDTSKMLGRPISNPVISPQVTQYNINYRENRELIDNKRNLKSGLLNNEILLIVILPIFLFIFGFVIIGEGLGGMFGGVIGIIFFISPLVVWPLAILYKLYEYIRRK